MPTYRGEMPSAEARDKLRQAMIARLPQGQQRVIDLMTKVNAKYVPSGRDKVIKETFDRYLTWTLTELRYRPGKGQAMYVTGESGAGKTDVVDRLLRTHEAMQPMEMEMGTFLPYVSVSLDGRSSLANLGNDILHKAGYVARRKIAESDVWPMLPAELAMRGIFVIHIDETQHLLQSAFERKKLDSSLKGLMNDPEWPMRFILSGMPETNDLLVSDEQAERRNFSVELPAIDMNQERFLVEKIIRQLCEEAEFDCDALIKSDVPQRIAHAANYQFGRVVEITLSGIQECAMAGATELVREHLAKAYLYHSHTRGRDDMNPFLADGWASLRPGYYIIEKEKMIGTKK